MKAKSPNLRLRNLLEMVEDLTLDTLLRFLQAHLEEEMLQMALLSDKTAYHFVICCLEMRHKVIVASNQSDDITYDPNLVQ